MMQERRLFLGEGEGRRFSVGGRRGQGLEGMFVSMKKTIWRRCSFVEAKREMRSELGKCWKRYDLYII